MESKQLKKEELIQKKYMNKKTIFIVAVLVLTTIYSTKAQNAVHELKKIRNAYIVNKHLSFDVEVYSYSTKVDKTADLVSKGCMKKNNDMYYSKFDNYELLINGEKALIVNNEQKSMKYYEYKLDKKKSGDPQANIDSLIMSSDSIVFRGIKNGEKHFTCFSKQGYVKQTELYVDSQTNLVKRMLYYYVSSTEEYEIDVDRVEIFYKNIETKVVDEKFFTFTKYFKKEKLNYFSTGKYQGYKMNYYNQKS